MHTHSFWAARLALAVFAIFLHSGKGSRAAVIYRETFGIAPGATADQFATVFDWQRFDNLGAPITTTGTASGVNFSVNGRPIDVSNVNAGPNNDGTFGPYANGILYLGATPSPSLAMTTEYTVDPAGYVPGSIVFSFYEGNNTAPQFFKLLVRVGGLWYATATNLASPAVSLANFGAQAQLKSLSFNPAASNWALVNFDGDYVKGETSGTGETTPSSMDLTLGAAPSADLAGPITGFGIYGENGGGTGNRRIDSFTIEATPLVVAANKTVTWVGNVSADWDTATANWRTNTPPGAATFADGDIVVFNDSSAVGEVNLVPLLMPATVTISNEMVNYKFSGGGGIGGGAVLIKNGIGLLTLSNNNSFTGGIYLQQGSIYIGDGGAAGSIGSGNITNNGSLIVNRTGTVVLSNAISGSGSLYKGLEGMLVLGGSNTYSGGTYVSGGTLLLNGLNSGGGFLTNTPGSTILGSGTNAGFVNVGGILSPGDGIGTFTAGGLELWSTNILDLGAANTPGGGINDLVVVNGSLILHNPTLIVNVPESPATGVPYRLISYTGTRTGTFNSAVIINGVDRYPATISYDDTAKTVNLTFTPPPVQPIVIYRETFGIAPGATVDLNAKVFDWERFDGQGVPVTTTGSSSGVNFSVNGRPTNTVNVNAGPNNDGTFGAYANGIFYFAATPSPSIGFTTEFVVNPTNYVPGSILFSWYEGNNTDPHLFRVLVRVGGAWYATDATFATTAVTLANFGIQAQLKSFAFNPAASNWWRVNFDGDFVLGETPGTGVAIASTLGDIFLIDQPTTDLAGSITAFGFYGENGGTGTGNRRVDSFTIEAAPAATTAKPRISNITTNSDNVLLTVISGPPGWNVRVLSSVDITTPVGAWSVVETGTFDVSGNFSASLPNAKEPQRFYLLLSP